MAKLSQKQIDRLNDMWELEEQAKQIVEEIAEMVAEPTARLVAVQAAIQAIEGTVPESYSDAWNYADGEHSREERMRVGFRSTTLPTNCRFH
tara:strand:+ start:300 stop:575 length:276 start_codon:yes stop_codon:yes gene_type:complete